MVVPVESTQLGVTSRVMSCGTAWARYCCLSPIEAELSITKRRSTLSIDWFVTVFETIVLTDGLLLTTLRSRQPAATTPTRARIAAAAPLRFRILMHPSKSRRHATRNALVFAKNAAFRLRAAGWRSGNWGVWCPAVYQ